MDKMSSNRRSKKIKPINPEEQPQIKQFIADNSPKPSDCLPGSAKKRRRSTGENNTSNKRRNSIPDLTNLQQSTSKNMEVSTESSMLEEIKKMEARLSETITKSKDDDLKKMEERLNANISVTINNSIQQALQTMQTTVNSAVQKNPIIQAHTIELQGLREENKRLNRKVNQLSAEHVKMRKQLTKIENKNLDRSLIVRGVAEEYKETEQMICDKIHAILCNIMHGETDKSKLTNAKQIILLNCRRLGRFARNRIRPISLELQHKQDVEFILENRFDLDRGIFVDKEYPPDVERKRKTLLPILRAAKRLTEYKKQSRLEDDKIILKGKPYTVNTLNQLPEELNVFDVSSKQNESVVVFFGEINPLSNFFPSPFTHEGVRYLSSEQFIQSTKAKYFGDLDTQEQILGCATSWECKELSRQIRNADESRWEEVAGDLCHPGICAKFHQNLYVLDTLIRHTGSKRIAESAADRIWGSGHSLGDPLCLDTSNWISQGLLGQILENIRDEYIQSMPFAHAATNQLTSITPSVFAPMSYGATPIATPNPIPPPTNPHTISEPVPIPQQQGINHDSAVEMTITDESSASTTPVSDTTATDTDNSTAVSNIPP